MPFITQGKTNWKYILIVVILAIIVGVILWCCLKSPEIEFPPVKLEEKVIITTDKTEYEFSEIVKITVKNNSNKSIWDFGVCGGSPWWDLQKLEENEWKELNFSFPSLESSSAIPEEPKEIKVICDFIVCEKPELSELKPGSEIIGEWDLSRSICEWPLKPVGIPETEPTPVERGTYRVFIVYGFNKDFSSPEREIVYSNEFKIKEKKEVISCSDDLDCPVKMKCEDNICVDVGCVEEGRGLPFIGPPEYFEHITTECCEGLTAIAHSASHDPNKNCEPTGILGVGRVCTKCSNGECGIGETKCNCPEDCK